MRLFDNHGRYMAFLDFILREFPFNRISLRMNCFGCRKKFVTDPAIGEKLGIHDYKVRLIRNYYGIPAILRDNTKRNEKIVALYKKGMIGRVIAKKFGLTTIYVYTIIRYAGAGKRKAARNQPR